MFSETTPTVDDLSSAEEEEERRKRIRGKPKRKIVAAAVAAANHANNNRDSGAHDEKTFTYYDEIKQKATDSDLPPVPLEFKPYSEFVSRHQYLTYKNIEESKNACDQSGSYFTSGTSTTAASTAGSFEALARSFTVGTASVGSSSSLSSSSSSSGDVCGNLISEAKRRVREAHQEMCRVKPSQTIRIHKLLSQCALPVYHPRTLTADLILRATESKSVASSEKAISNQVESWMRRSDQAKLPHFSAKYEQRMLYEAGKWPLDVHSLDKIYAFPACRNGENCICQKVDFDVNTSPVGLSQKGFTMMGFMYKDQYDHFCSTGTAPSPANPCILCVRKYLVDLVCDLRLSKASYREMAKLDDSVAPVDYVNCILGLYFNSVDCDGGYFRRATLLPKGDGEPIIGPLVQMNLTSLRLAEEPVTKRRFIDQSRIVWSPPKPDKPFIGETVKHFSPGAAKF